MAAPRSPAGSLRVLPALPVALAGLAFLVVYVPVGTWLVHRWSLGVWYHSHGFAVPPIVAWLSWEALRRRGPGPLEPSAWGFLFLVPAIALVLADAVLRFEILSAVSLVLVLPGLALLLRGAVFARRLAFPLAFLAFAIPIPLLVARRVVLPLRSIAAVGTGMGLDAIGFDVVREGTHLQYGAHSILIADACSGFSSLLALLMVAILFLHGRPLRWWKAGLLLAAVFVFAAFMNVLRCIALALFVAAEGAGILGTWVHPATGLVSFGMAFVLLWLVYELLAGRPPAAAAREAHA